MKILERNIGREVRVYYAGFGERGIYEGYLEEVIPFVAVRLHWIEVRFVGIANAIQKIVLRKDGKAKVLYRNPLIHKKYPSGNDREIEKIRERTFGRVVFLEQEIEGLEEVLRFAKEDEKEVEKVMKKIPYLIEEGKNYIKPRLRQGFESRFYNQLKVYKDDTLFSITDGVEAIEIGVKICKALSEKKSFEEAINMGIGHKVIDVDVPIYSLWDAAQLVRDFHSRGKSFFRYFRNWRRGGE